MRGCILRCPPPSPTHPISEPRLWQVVNLTIGSPSLQVDAEAWKHIQERIVWAGSLKIHLVVYHMKSSASIIDDWGFKLFCGVLPRLLSLQVSLERGLVMAPIRLDDPPATYSNLKQICVEASRYPETRAWCENLLSNTPEVVCLALPSPENMSFSPTSSLTSGFLASEEQSRTMLSPFWNAHAVSLACTWSVAMVYLPQVEQKSFSLNCTVYVSMRARRTRLIPTTPHSPCPPPSYLPY